MAWLLILALAAPRPGFCWGERGHNAIARAAAMRMSMDVAVDSGAAGYFQRYALELGHIANIPDIYWRSLGKDYDALNSPTHYIDADAWTDDIASLPLDYARAKELASKSRVDGKPVGLFENGTLIWRAQQLYEKMAAAFARAKSEEPGSKAFKADVQQALVYGGLMAHFIGDASMPYHTTIDHDGYATGNGGIHAFFESDVPNTETPALELDVYRRLPRAAAAFEVDKKFAAGKRQPAAYLARALCVQAFARIGETRAIDDRFIIGRSLPAAPGRPKAPAVRGASPVAAAAAFHPLIEEQLALAAAVLTRLWRGAWEEGGKPDLSKAHTYAYALEPEFVMPDYDLDAVKSAQAKRAPKSELQPR